MQTAGIKHDLLATGSHWHLLLTTLPILKSIVTGHIKRQMVNKAYIILKIAELTAALPSAEEMISPNSHVQCDSDP